MEGPGVHHVADKLSSLEGQVITEATGNAQQPLQRLVGQRISRVRAVKKRLFIDCENDHIVVHFLMYGSYRLNEQQDREERLSLRCKKDILNIYSSSVKVLEAESAELTGYDRPEEDVLSEKFDTGQALRAIKERDVPVVDLLLNQDVFGGVGNRLKSEILWNVGVHPDTVASTVSESTARELVEQAMTWSQHWYEAKQNDESVGFGIYRGGNCPECRKELSKAELGRSQRVTYWCEKCQS